MKKRIVCYEPDQKIISRGDVERRMYIILEGKVEISINDGIKKVVLSTLGKRDFFGEMSLFIDAPRTADVCTSCETHLTYIDSVAELDEFLKKNHSFSNRMVMVLSERIATTNHLLLKELGDKKSSTLVGFAW